MAITKRIDKGYLWCPQVDQLCDLTQTRNKMEQRHTVVVHRFKVGEVDDPDLYAAQPIYDWEQSEIGKWVKSHAAETPIWHRQKHDFLLWGYEYIITAKLIGKDFTFWMLKYGKLIDTAS